MPKHVASRTLDRVDWNNSTLIKGDVAEAVRRLKEQPGNELQVHGSGELIQTLLAHDLIDEFRLWISPVVLGTGKRLFGSGTIPARLELVQTLPASTGAVLHVYRSAGRVDYGSFALEQLTQRRGAAERRSNGAADRHSEGRNDGHSAGRDADRAAAR